MMICLLSVLLAGSPLPGGSALMSNLKTAAGSTPECRDEYEDTERRLAYP